MDLVRNERVSRERGLLLRQRQAAQCVIDEHAPWIRLARPESHSPTQVSKSGAKVAVFEVVHARSLVHARAGQAFQPAAGVELMEQLLVIGNERQHLDAVPLGIGKVRRAGTLPDEGHIENDRPESLQKGDCKAAVFAGFSAVESTHGFESIAPNLQR